MAFKPGNTGEASQFPDGFSGSPRSNVQTITGTKVLTLDDLRIQILTPDVAIQAAQLPATAFVGEGWTFTCNPASAFLLEVRASGGSIIVTLSPGETLSITALTATPTLNTNWVLQVPQTILNNGSASVPSLRFSGASSDTGMFSPGTDQIALSTAGAQRLLVNASGDTLIGTSSVIGPGARMNVLSGGNVLHIQSTSGAANNFISYNSAGQATLVLSNGGDLSVGTLTSPGSNANINKAALVLESRDFSAASTGFNLARWRVFNGSSGLSIGVRTGTPYNPLIQINQVGASLNFLNSAGNTISSLSETGAATIGPVGTAFNGANPIHNINGNLWFGTVSGTAYSGEFAIGVNTRVGGSAGLAARTSATTTGTAIYIANLASNAGLDAFSVRTNNTTDLTTTPAKTILAASADGQWVIGAPTGSSTHTLRASNASGRVFDVNNTFSSAAATIITYLTENTVRGYFGFNSTNEAIFLNNSGNTVTTMSSGGGWLLGAASFSGKHIAQSTASDIFQVKRVTTDASVGIGLEFQNDATAAGSHYSVFYGYSGSARTRAFLWSAVGGAGTVGFITPPGQWNFGPAATTPTAAGVPVHRMMGYLYGASGSAAAGTNFRGSFGVGANVRFGGADVSQGRFDSLLSGSGIIFDTRTGSSNALIFHVNAAGNTTTTDALDAGAIGQDAAWRLGVDSFNTTQHFTAGRWQNKSIRGVSGGDRDATSQIIPVFLGNTNDNTSVSYVLLAPAYVATNKNADGFDGWIEQRRGSTASNHAVAKHKVHVNSAFTSNVGTFITEMNVSSGLEPRLVIATFAAVVYIALELPQGSARQISWSGSCIGTLAAPIFVSSATGISAVTDLGPSQISLRGSTTFGASLYTGVTGHRRHVINGYLTAGPPQVADQALAFAGSTGISANFGQSGFDYAYNNRFNSTLTGGLIAITPRLANEDRLFVFATTADDVPTTGGTVTNTLTGDALGTWRIGPASSANLNCIVNGRASVTHGLTFPASVNLSADANTLDDYEEGIWTPSFTFGGASVGITYAASRYGRYQKIGNRVYFHCYVVLTSKGTSVGNFNVVGLPFAAVAAASGGHSAVSVWVGSGISRTGHSITAYVSAGTSTIDINGISTTADAASAVNFTNVHVSNTGSIMLSGHYITAS